MCNRACEIVSLSQAAFSFIFGREENRPNIKEEKSVWLCEATCGKQSCVPKTIADFSNLLYHNLLSLLATTTKFNALSLQRTEMGCSIENLRC